MDAPSVDMELSFEQALIEVWRQALVENAKVVELDTERYPVRLPSKRRLRQGVITSWHGSRPECSR